METGEGMGNKVGPISEFKAQKAYTDFFARSVKEWERPLHALVGVVGSSVTLSIEAIWPSLRDLARRVKDAPITLSNGWTIRSAETGDRADLAFTMEHEETPGGFVFNCRMRSEMTEEAQLRIAKITDAKIAMAQAIEDETIRQAALAGLENVTLPEVSQIEADPESYRITDMATSVTCCVYREDGLFPPGYSGYGSDLEETLKAGFSGEHYQSGRIFGVNPSIYLQFGEEQLRQSLPIMSEKPIVDTVMSVEALTALAEAFDELELSKEVKDRLILLGDIGFEHFSRLNSEGLLIEMGMGSVLSTGFPREPAVTLFARFFTAAAAADMAKAATGLLQTVATMKANGNTTAEHAVEWYDSYYQVFVADESDSINVLSLTAGDDVYRIEFPSVEKDGLPREISAGVVPANRSFETPLDPEASGFLFRFEIGGTEYWPMDICEFTTRNYIRINRLTRSIVALKQLVEG